MIARVRSAVAAALIVASCGGGQVDTIEGIVVSVVGDLVEVESFTVLTTNGDSLVFEPDHSGDFDFPLPHLGAHMRSLDPVRVSYIVGEDRTLIAVEIGDASPTRGEEAP